MNNICFPNSTEAIQWSNPMCPLGADHSPVQGNRLRQNPNGSFEVAPKPMGYVLGELLRSSAEKLYTVAAWAFSGFRSEVPAKLPTPEESLQAKIDALEWNVRLCVSPPRPNRSYPIKKEQAENWINAHTCEKERKAARVLIEKTRHVSQAEFEKELKVSVDQFNEWLETQESKDYVVVVSSSTKSNYWVAQLALPHLKRLPRQVFKLDYNTFEGSFVVSKALKEYRQKYPEIDKIVFFDDAAYSCQQSNSLIVELGIMDCIDQNNEVRRGDCAKEKRNFTIAAIIPFMRAPECVLPIYCPKTNANGEKYVHVFFSQRLPTMLEILPESLRHVNIGCGINKIPVYFDHKIPDSLSTCSRSYKEGFVHYYMGGFCEEDLGLQEEARAKYSQKLVEKFESHQKKDTKFIDDITPPYKH